MDADILPEQSSTWDSCAVALDGCISFMPGSADRIMKLDPNNGDAVSSVRDEVGGGGTIRYNGTVVGIGRCMYGIPEWYQRILKYDLINDVTSFVGQEAEEVLRCNGNGVVGTDGCIYALEDYSEYPRVLNIDKTNNYHGFV